MQRKIPRLLLFLLFALFVARDLTAAPPTSARPSEPLFWTSRLVDVDRAVRQVKKGEVSVLARSPGGRKVYLVAYGGREDRRGTANYNSAAGGTDPSSYARLPTAGSLIVAAEPSQAPVPILQPVYRWAGSNGVERLVTHDTIRLATHASKLEVAFYAVVTNQWLSGLVPIFSVEKSNRFELRRRPPRGQENFSEPLFFGAPNAEETAPAAMAGRWECYATRGGSPSYLAWEMTIEGETISARFDPFTDYRFAHITAGTFRTNHFELRIEYINDVYLMAGTLKESKLGGAWRRTDDGESGTWTALRPIPVVTTGTNLVTLYEWRRNADDVRRYEREETPVPAGWRKSAQPLCRVWDRGTMGP